MFLPRGVSTAYRTRTNFVRVGDLSNVITHAKFEINCYKIVPLAKGWSFMFQHYYTADAINTAKPCRAACDGMVSLCKVATPCVDCSGFNRTGRTVLYIALSCCCYLIFEILNIVLLKLTKLKLYEIYVESKTWSLRYICCRWNTFSRFE